MYLYAVDGMLEGKVYKKAISNKAIRKYLDNILREYGSVGLKKVIQAVGLHVDYRRSCGHQVDSIERICREYDERV